MVQLCTLISTRKLISGISYFTVHRFRPCAQFFAYISDPIFSNDNAAMRCGMTQRSLPSLFAGAVNLQHFRDEYSAVNLRHIAHFTQLLPLAWIAQHAKKISIEWF